MSNSILIIRYIKLNGFVIVDNESSTKQYAI